MKTLFVCRSNVARSQMGEALYNHLTDSQDGSSAGTEITFREVTFDVRLAMLEVDIDLGDAQPKQLTEEMAEAAGRIILMTNIAVPDYLRDNSKVQEWPMPDPREHHDFSLEEARDKIHRLIEERLL